MQTKNERKQPPVLDPLPEPAPAEKTAAIVIRDRFEVDSAEIDRQIATAKRYPRDIVAVKRGIETMATIDRETAEACFYSLPRGGKTIQGPGVRMAELAIYSFGNVRVQTRIVETVIDGPTPHVTVQAACHDLEKNVWVGMEKRRRIIAKKDFKTGRRRPVDEDDINLATNACAAIAFRDAAFKVIPGALVKPALEAAKRVAIGDVKTLETRRADALAKFAKMGVNQARVLVALEKTSVEEVGLAELETMFGMYTEIRDGQATIEEIFPPESKTTVHGVAGVDQQTGEILGEAGPPTTAQNDPTLADQRVKLLDRVREILLQLAPGEGSEVRQARADLVEMAFGHRSWSRLLVTPVQYIEVGLKAMEDQLARSSNPLGEGDQGAELIGERGATGPEDEPWLS